MTTCPRQEIPTDPSLLNVSNAVNRINRDSYLCSGGSRISQNGHQPIIWQTFCQKLYKNEQNWIRHCFVNKIICPYQVIDEEFLRQLKLSPTRW